MRRIATILLAVSISVASGAAAARWALGDANSFYMSPTAGYGTPAYARQQPVADTFWERQDGTQPSN